MQYTLVFSLSLHDDIIWYMLPIIWGHDWGLDEMAVILKIFLNKNIWLIYFTAVWGAIHKKSVLV